MALIEKDLTHKEKIDSLLEEMKEKGGNPKKVGKYVECLSGARERVMRAEQGIAVTDRNLEEALDEERSKKEIEEMLEKYETEVVEKYREAEKLINNARDMEKELSELEMQYSKRILKIERIDLTDGETPPKKIQFMWFRIYRWAGGKIVSGAGSAAKAFSKLFSDSEELEWPFRQGTYLAGNVPYKNADEAMNYIEDEKQMSEELLQKAEERLENME